MDNDGGPKMKGGRDWDGMVIFALSCLFSPPYVITSIRFEQLACQTTFMFVLSDFGVSFMRAVMKLNRNWNEPVPWSTNPEERWMDNATDTTTTSATLNTKLASQC